MSANLPHTLCYRPSQWQLLTSIIIYTDTWFCNTRLNVVLGKKHLSDVRANAFNAPSVQIVAIFVRAGHKALTDYADDGEDDGDDELEDADPVDRLLEGDPEEGVDDTHDGAARANLTLICAKWKQLVKHRVS